ncbi:MAG: hypothetical protein AAF703_01390 [Cyanobacteria bacterium P01_D01_bin.105]
MTRLMIFAVIVMVMATVAIQNQETTVLTILGAQQTPEIPFGLLLVGAFGAGALLTIFLYSIVGSRRPPERKYRPMGRRVPYPDNPATSTNPPTSPTSAEASPAYAATNSAYGSSTAFVNEPSPQDSVRSGDNPRSTAAGSTVNTPVDSSIHIPANPSANPNSSINQGAFAPPIFSNAETSPSPTSRIDKPESEKKKRRFTAFGRSLTGRPLDRASENAPKKEEEKRIGDDWGELRTAEHINSWDTDEVRRASGASAPGASAPEARRKFLDFIGIGASATTPAAGRGTQDSQVTRQLTDDIAAGWDETSGDGGYSYENSPYESGTYEDSLDSGWEQGYAQGSADYGPTEGQRRVYRDGIYSDERYSDGRYSNGNYSGSEYGDDYPEGPYEQTPYEQPPYETEDSSPEEDGVYEADYRVIVPPFKPLEEIPPQASSEKDDER